MTKHHKAVKWFREKKNKLVSKMLRLEMVSEGKNEKVVENLVIEDVSAVFVHLVKSSGIYLGEKAHKMNILQEGINQTLSMGEKQQEIVSLHNR